MVQTYLVSMISFLVIILVPTILGQKPQVTVPQGTIEGSTARSLNGRKFFTFEGIPYAQPPVGKFRFKKPVPSTPWKDVLHAKNVYTCLQYNQFVRPGQDPVTGEEDCLYLNIYSPSLDPNSKLDVIVYTHGGAFMFLYGAYHGPRYLLDRDVVFISLNYRLGPLGFLTTESDLVPGNNGIRDQILALRWVKSNVEYFGGNPNSITNIGMSAGAASVYIHNLSPLTDGLFHRGFSQSGSPLNPWVLMEGGLEKTIKLASNVGCSGKIPAVIECLKTVQGKQIVESVRIFQPWMYNPFSPFGVVVDSWSEDPVLPEHPLSLLQKGHVKDLPWVFSMADFEGLYPAFEFLEDRNLEEIETRWNELLPFILDYNYTVDLKLQNEVSQKIKKQYLGGQKLTQNNVNSFIQMLSDRLFRLGIHQTARLHSKAVKSDIFFYLFKYRGAHVWYEGYSKPRKNFGAAHGEDTSFLLSTLTVDTTSTEQDRNMIKFFVDFMTSFAKNGVPEIGSVWTPVGKDGGNLEGLVIESAKKVAMQKITVESEQFWNSLPIKENDKLIRGPRDEL